MSKILEEHAMKIQYDNALDDRLENAASGLCNATLHKLFPSTDFIITGQYYFEKEKLYADYVVERIWANGRRVIVLVVEVKATLNQDKQQTFVYAARFISGECMFYWLTKLQPTLNPLANDFMDIEDDYVSIRGHVATMKQRDLFR
ncbi:hypothetical protein EJ07DRAFT_177435 [Lizonia empirigonia]|nr:hypothetical protein EJ07DRAFT_177435 [Lizonia empirigonia]